MSKDDNDVGYGVDCLQTDSVHDANERETWKSEELYDADLNCDHDVDVLWSGVKCRKCPGWFCH